MNYETINFERHGRTGMLVLNRPHRLNALSSHTVVEMNDLLDAVQDDDTVRVLIITGAPRADGRPCFCAGADLNETAEAGSILEKERTVLDCGEGLINPMENAMRVLFGRLRGYSKPVIAAIDGICSARGIELAVSCDIILVSETAQISDLHIKNMGRISGGGVTAMLPHAFGLYRAKEMAFTGEPIDGKEAWRLGFANHVFAPDKLMDGAKALAEKIAAMQPDAVRTAKASMNASL